MENKNSQPKNDLLWNLLSFLMIAAIIGAGVIFITIFSNPNSAMNPFPPFTMPEAIVLPTSRPTFPATWTATVAPSTPTPAPPTADVPVVSATPAEVGTPSPTETQQPPTGAYAFGLQTDPASISSVIYRPEWGCEWMGLAGNAVDLQNSPVKGIRVQVGGYLGAAKIDLLSLTGTALQYGQAGYEFTLAEKPVASTGRLWVQLLDQSDLPLSDKIYFDTFSGCDQNLIIINFKQVRK